MKYDKYIKAGELFEPVRGTLPAALVTSDATQNSRLTFTNEAVYRWDDVDFRFNNLGQKWKADVRPTFGGPDTYGGVKNCATPRRFSAPAAGMSNSFFGSTIDVEFLFTGTRLSIQHMNLGGNNSGTSYAGEVEMWVEYGGGMWRMSDRPKQTTRTDGAHSYRNVVFPNRLVNRRIRLRFGTAGFTSVMTDGDSVVAPSPDRYVMLLDGDSWVESTQALTADGGVTQNYTTGIAYFAFERSTFQVVERAQGATGFFSNGAGFITDDTQGTATSFILFIQVTIMGLSRWMSGGGLSNINSRIGWMSHAAASLTTAGMSGFTNYAGEDFGNVLGRRPILYVLWGTWNDASVGGVSFATMYARAKACYQALYALDPYCTFVHVSPEPFDDTLFGNAIGSPRYGDKSQIHVAAQMKAASEVPNVHYVNAFGPEKPWWRGAGPAEGSSFGVPSTSQQARIVSPHDGIHYGREGGEYAAGKLMDAIADIPVYRDRVDGLI